MDKKILFGRARVLLKFTVDVYSRKIFKPKTKKLLLIYIARLPNNHTMYLTMTKDFDFKISHEINLKYELSKPRIP